MRTGNADLPFELSTLSRFMLTNIAAGRRRDKVGASEPAALFLK